MLLQEARPGVVDRLKQSRDFLLMNVLDHELPDHSHAVLAWAILAGIIALATTGIMSMLNASLLGVAAMLATRCISVSDARRSLDLPVLVTIAASFALGNALEKTGAADWMRGRIIISRKAVFMMKVCWTRWPI